MPDVWRCGVHRVIRPHRMQAVHSWDLVIQMSYVAWYVCLSVCWLYGCAVQKRLNRSKFRLGVWLLRAQETIIRSVEIPSARGNFGCCPAYWKALGVSAAMYAAKGIIQSSITARWRDCCSPLQCCRPVLVILHRPREKSAAAMRYCQLFATSVISAMITDRQSNRLRDI